jgi:hypothetical protein
MAKITRFDTPASLRDMPDGSPFYELWHTFISDQMAEPTPGGGNVGEFYNASKVDVNVAGHRSLVWMAFPRSVLMPDRDNRLQAYSLAEDRDAEDEYCEWCVTRNDVGKITKVVFVTESPEYWEELWKVDRNRVVELYKSLLGEPSVVEADLHDATGNYVRRNKWNDTGSKGIVHLIQIANTLGAAIGIAQNVRESNKIMDNFEKVGLGNTSVDPRVDLDVNVLVRKGLSVTLLDPIALYIADWDDTGWTKPNGKPVGNYWKIVRGKPGQVLRLEYEVPKKEGFVVGDIRIGGRPIEWGGQIAEHVSVTIVGTAGTRASGTDSSTLAGNREANEEEIKKPVSRQSIVNEESTRRQRRERVETR